MEQSSYVHKIDMNVEKDSQVYIKPWYRQRSGQTTVLGLFVSLQRRALVVVGQKSKLMQLECS